MKPPYYEDAAVTLYHNDGLAILAELPDACVDAVITDPPYSSGGQYRGDRALGTHSKYVQTNSRAREDLAEFSGDNRDQRAYGYWCALWLAEALRVTKPGGACLLFSDWRQLPTTADALQSGGWVWRGVVPWWKPNGRNTQGRFANTCEYVLWGTSGPRPADASETLRGFFQVSVAPTSERDHVAQKPLEVMRELVRIVRPGETVLDPFAGSCTTGVAALIEGRRFIGSELSGHHVEQGANRLRQAALRPSVRDEQQALPMADLLRESVPGGRGETLHKPYTDDGVEYCGWDGHDGCGEVWPCSTVRARPAVDSLTADGAE